MKYFLGIDIGTSSAKTLLVDENGGIAAEASFDYPLNMPRPLWSEQNPHDWWKAAVEGIRRVLAVSDASAKDIAAVGLSGQMHGLVLLDGRGEVLRPAILWNDQRTGAQCASITERVGFSRLLELTGNPVLPGFTAPKILWVRENEPEIFRKAERFLLPKDYIRFRLTGAYATEVSDASGTSLLDLRRRTWSGEMLDALGLKSRFVPECAESIEITGRISRDAATLTGLLEGTPVAGGGGDQAAQAVGSGIVREGRVSVTLGTSGVVFAPADAPLVDPLGRLHSFCHAVPGQWHVMGVMLSAGGSLRWFRDTLCEKEKEEAAKKSVDPYELILRDAATIPAGCEGLVFLPYLSGERTPHPDPHARGVFFGLTLRHQKAHMARAVLEGVTFGLRDSMELIKAQGTAVESVRVSGGGSRSALWRKILADVFNAPISVLNTSEGAAYGAALIAGCGAGVFSDLKAICDRLIREESVTSPDPETLKTYEGRYRLYASLYDRFKPVFDALSGT